MLPSHKSPAVLFIGGHNRSGSTMLSRLLGREPSVVSVGELIFIGDRGFRENQLCSCGKPFRACEFWVNVVALVARRDANAWFARLVDLRDRLARIRHIPVLASSGASSAPLGFNASPSRGFRAEAADYVAMLGDLFVAVATVAGTNVVVDSSKQTAYGFFLNRSQSLRLYPVHLVRDCRAVAFSQQRRRVRPEIYWKTELMPRFPPARTVFDWTLLNSLMHVLGMAAGRYRRIRYEDIVASPAGATKALLDWVEADPDPCLPVDVGEHQLSGNPMRFKPDFEIKPDVEWLRKMSPRDKAVATALGAPLLIGYGYGLRAGADARATSPSGQVG